MENKRVMTNGYLGYQEFTTHDYLSTDSTVKQASTTKQSRNAYNVSKIKILSAIDYLTRRKQTANSIRICVLTGLDKQTVFSLLYRFRIGYIDKEIDNKYTNGCLFKLKLKDKGKAKLDKMLDRMDSGLTLNLRGLPSKTNYNGFTLLPGIAEYERMRKEGKI